MREIHDLFNSHEFVARKPVEDAGGERRTAAEEFHAAIDWTSPEEAQRYLDLVADVLDRYPEAEDTHRYGTQECDQDRLRADELKGQVVESLLPRWGKRDLLEDAVERWGEIVETSRLNRPGFDGDSGLPPV